MNQQHLWPRSYAWGILRLAVVKVSVEKIHHFLNVCGIDGLKFEIFLEIEFTIRIPLRSAWNCSSRSPMFDGNGFVDFSAVKRFR